MTFIPTANLSKLPVRTGKPVSAFYFIFGNAGRPVDAIQWNFIVSYDRIPDQSTALSVTDDDSYHVEGTANVAMLQLITDTQST